MSDLPPLYVYVDETGDRGVSVRSSKFFAMAAVAIPAEDEPDVRALVAACRSKFNIPATKALHWQEHIKVYPRRQFVADAFAALPSLCVNYVIFEKTAIPATSTFRTDRAAFYNYTAGLIMERVLLTAKYWPGGSRQLIVRFGHVKSFDHTETLAHFASKRADDPTWIPWHLLEQNVKFVDTQAYDGLQVADVYAGMLKAAICPDHYGGFEEHHFLKIRHQIRRHRGKSWGAGFKVIAEPGTMPSLPWWPHKGL